MLTFSKSETYSEPCQTSTMKRFAKIVNRIIVFPNCNYLCNINLPPSLLHEINIMRQLLQRQLFYVKNYGVRGERGPFFIYLLTYSNKLAYLQLITVLIYGNSEYMRINSFLERVTLLKMKFFEVFFKDFVTKHLLVYLQ